MGCATALELAARGAREILLLERAVPGAEASSAAAGMLAAQAESQSDEERRYFVAAREAYATWADELHEWSGGVDIGYRKSGLMEIASTPAERDKLASIVRHDRELGLNAEWLDGKAAREVEPELSPSVEAAAYFPDEAQVDPPQLLRALLVAISRHPTITIRGGSTVSSILEQSGRCTGVILDGHDVIHADAVVLAAGSWSSLVPGVPRSIPKVEPVRGQLVMLDERPPKLRTILFMDKSYVVPRGDGRVVCGSTMENVGPPPRGHGARREDDPRLGAPHRAQPRVRRALPRVVQLPPPRRHGPHRRSLPAPAAVPRHWPLPQWHLARARRRPRGHRRGARERQSVVNAIPPFVDGG